MKLSGKKALVTGSAAGIGREIARRFAAEGAEITAVDWDADGNRETADIIKAQGGSCRPIQADVGSETDVVAAFQKAGAIDILVNNAGSAAGDARVMELSGEGWDKVLAVCLKSVFLCTREALKTMTVRRSGAIVNMSSVNALAGINLTAYSAAKGGILSLTRLTAAQYAAYGVRVNAICPGTILSQSSEIFYREHPEIDEGLRALYPAGTYGKVEDVASCALFLVSDEASFINGVTLPVDGGLLATRLIPALAAEPGRERPQGAR